MSIRKGLYFRLSDFVNEYDSPDYSYPTNDAFQQESKRPVHGLMKGDEGKAGLVKWEVSAISPSRPSPRLG